MTLNGHAIGTVWDLCLAAQLAHKHGIGLMMSASDGGDGGDDFLVDAAVGLRCGQLRAGAVEG